MDDGMIRRRDYNTVFRKWTNRSRMSQSLQSHSECTSGPITPSDQLKIPEFPDCPRVLKNVHKNISTRWWQVFSLLPHDPFVEVTSITCTTQPLHSSPNLWALRLDILKHFCELCACWWKSLTNQSHSVFFKVKQNIFETLWSYKLAFGTINRSFFCDLTMYWLKQSLISLCSSPKTIHWNKLQLKRSTVKSPCNKPVRGTTTFSYSRDSL